MRWTSEVTKDFVWKHPEADGVDLYSPEGREVLREGKSASVPRRRKQGSHVYPGTPTTRRVIIKRT